MSFLRYTPHLLVLLRLVIAIFLLVDALDGDVGLLFVLGLVAALVSDIFDGVLARWMGVATERLRLADSVVDSILIVCVFASLLVTRGEILKTYVVPIASNIGAYILSLVIPLVKFRGIPAYHAYSAKAAGALLFAAVAALFLIGDVPWLMWLALASWFISHIDRILITLILPESHTDVSSFLAAITLRRENRRPI